jgi:hypothetical protein
LSGCHLTDHARSGVLLDAEGLELEDGPEDMGDTHAVLPDNDDNEPIIPIPAETPPCLPSPQPHAPPTVEALTMDMPDNSQVTHPRVPRARTVPAHNRISQENGPHYCMQMPEVFTEQLAETSKHDEVQRCHIPYIRASHPKFRMSDPIRSDPQIHTGSVTISFFIHILFI